eukprot:22286-Hanusia_phi.AAC.2
MPRQVLSAGWVVPIVPSGLVLEDHSIVVEDEKILDILPTKEVASKYPDVPVAFSSSTSVLLPGFVNCHTHSAMTLLRGLADDLELMPWLNNHIWPAEGKFAGAEFVEDGTRVAMAEMIKGGTTCFNDMYFFPSEIAKVADEGGMRAFVGLICIGFPSSYCGSPEKSMEENIKAYIGKGMEIREQVMAKLTRVRPTIAPHAPYTCGEEGMKYAGEKAKELGLPFHIHLHETSGECSDWMENKTERPLKTLERLGLVDERLVAVHMTQLDDDEIELLAKRGVRKEAKRRRACAEDGKVGRRRRGGARREGVDVA